MPWFAYPNVKTRAKAAAAARSTVGLAWDAANRIHARFATAKAALYRGWQALSLAQQFAAAAAAILVLGMAVLGLWVVDRIKHGVMQNAAASGALFMDSYIAPLVQELATTSDISPQNRLALDRALKLAAISNRVSGIKIWRTDSTVVYSNWAETVGQKYTPTPSFKRAMSGVISAEFEGHHHETGGPEHTLAKPLLEIYSPVRELNSGRIIAVSEFYEAGGALKSELRRAEGLSWLVVGLVTAAMMAALSGIVSRGSATITEQRSRLEAQVAELKSLLAENAELSQRIQSAYGRTASMNERFLRRVGADLHDGPAQLLSLALLRLDGLAPLVDGSSGTARSDVQPTRSVDQAAVKDFERIRSSLSDALKELRQISGGLALPELVGASLSDVVGIAVRAHERKTDTKVQIDIDATGALVPNELKICIYRCVQEGLNNAFRHAGGQGQRVAVTVRGASVDLVITDRGPGIGAVAAETASAGLGLSGMRDRVASLGGTMDVGRGPEGGTRVAATFNLETVKRVLQHG